MSDNQKPSLHDLYGKNSDDSSTEAAPPRRSFPEWLVPLGLLLGFVAILGLLFGERVLPAIPVRVAPVITLRSAAPLELVDVASEGTEWTSGSLLFQASGWIEPDPYTIFVPTLVGGTVEEVYVLEGEAIKKGQQLAKLIDQDAILDLDEKKARVDTLKSEIEASRARIPVVESKRSGATNQVASEKSKLAELQDRLSRLRSLPRGSIPAIDLTATQLQVQQQQSRIDQVSSDLPGLASEIEMIGREIAAKESALREFEVGVARARLALDRHLIRSPIDGIVLRLHAVPGKKRLIQMDDSESAYMVELFDPQKLQARIDVPLSEASRLSLGQPVEMVCDLLPDLVLQGVLTRITGEADLQRNTLQVKVEVKNPHSRLRPEMLVRGKFFPLPRPVEKSLTPSPSPAGRPERLSLYVPEVALFNVNQVWVVNPDNRAELRTVTLAAEKREGHQVAADGLRSGEQVILPPHERLSLGARIKIIP